MTEMQNTTMLQRIAALNGSFSPKQLKLAQYIENNYESLAYITMTELAALSKVSETTVVRLVNKLEYKGFPEFMTALRKELTSKKNVPMMSEFNIKKGQYKFPNDVCTAIFSMEIQVMTDTLANLNQEDFQKAVDKIFAAKEVIIVGCGANTCCSKALAFGLQVLKPNVYEIEKLGLSEEAHIRSSYKNAVGIVFSTPRYPTETQKIIKLMHEKNIPLIGFSNSLLSPIFPYCQLFFQVPEKYVTYIDSNSSYMALIHALSFGVCLKDKSKARGNIEKYNSFVRNTGFYVNGEIDLVEIEDNL